MKTVLAIVVPTAADNTHNIGGLLNKEFRMGKVCTFALEECKLVLFIPDQAGADRVLLGEAAAIRQDSQGKALRFVIASHRSEITHERIAPLLQADADGEFSCHCINFSRSTGSEPFDAILSLACALGSPSPDGDVTDVAPLFDAVVNRIVNGQGVSQSRHRTSEITRRLAIPHLFWQSVEEQDNDARRIECLKEILKNSSVSGAGWYETFLTYVQHRIVRQQGKQSQDAINDENMEESSETKYDDLSTALGRIEDVQEKIDAEADLGNCDRTLMECLPKDTSPETPPVKEAQRLARLVGLNGGPNQYSIQPDWPPCVYFRELDEAAGLAKKGELTSKHLDQFLAWPPSTDQEWTNALPDKTKPPGSYIEWFSLVQESMSKVVEGIASQQSS